MMPVRFAGSVALSFLALALFGCGSVGSAMTRKDDADKADKPANAEKILRESRELSTPLVPISSLPTISPRRRSTRLIARSIRRPISMNRQA